MTQTSHLSRQDLDTLAVELDAIYDDVPSTCCANSGECCSLTPAEMDEGWATMFPLYKAEYARIADHVRRTFNAERAAQLLSITDERPERCPFLGDDNGCTIYAVRPLICRTYAVMNHDTIAEAAERHRGELPEQWVRQFVMRETGMVCPRVTVTQPEKLVRHANNLVTGAYERAMVRLSRRLELVSAQRKRLIRPLIRTRSWPLRWTWGGYNALCLTPVEWVTEKLQKYWRRSQLNDLD
ncbi:MAG: YkgJ family cysteine cluster protein [Candidatus Latescibacterota bacterium]